MANSPTSWESEESRTSSSSEFPGRLGKSHRPGVSASRTVTRHAWLALAILALINMTNYFDRLIVTVVAQPVKAHFGLSDTQLALLTGPAFVTIYCLASIAFGWMVDRRSRKVVLAIVLVLWSAMTIASGLARSYAQLLVARAGVGVGEGGSNPAAMSLLSDYFPLERRSTAAAAFTSVGMVGILLSFLIGGWIAETYGWRTTFFIAGVPGLVLALIVIFAVKEPARGAIDQQVHHKLSIRESAKLLWTTRPFPLVVAAIGLGTFGNLGMMQWLPLFFIRSHGLGLTEVGLFFGPALVCGLILGMLLGGIVGDRLARRSVGHMLLIAIFANAAVVPLYWAALWAGSLPVALSLTLLAAATSVLYSPMSYAIIQTLAPSSVRGAAIGVFNVTGGVIGQGMLPLLVGIASDAFAPKYGDESLRIALSLCIPICLASSLAFIGAKRIIDRTSAPANDMPPPHPARASTHL